MPTAHGPYTLINGAVPVTQQDAAGNLISGGITLTERSSSIVAGAMSQQLAAANLTRRYLFIQNPYSASAQNIAASENLYIRFGAVAATIDTGTSIELLPGASITFEANAIPTAAIQIIATTISHKFIALEG